MVNNRIEVCVQEGKLIGIIEKNVYGNNFIAFRGIPYAKPPIGELRFKDPVPPESWSGSRDASQFGNKSVQITLFQDEVAGDEDCLYLNVYTTKIEVSKKRAVMMWIHGGSFNMGSGDSFFHGPDYIMKKDVVLVTLNYRLDALGFLNLYDEVATGNQGIKDVIMALQWIQKNISQFGGDPENVTLFGNSAGAIIAHYLTVSPLAKGLFHKAILQSGTIRCPCIFTERQPPSMNKGFQLAKKLGKETTDPKIAYEFLKTIDAKKLIKASQSLMTKEERKILRVAFTPTLDHESANPVFTEDIETYRNQKIKMPLLLGFNSREGTFLANSDLLGHITKEDLKRIDSNFENTIFSECLSTLSKISMTAEELRFLYFGDEAISEKTLSNYIDFLEDEFIYKAAMEVVDIQIKQHNDNEPKTYLYKFSYENANSAVRKIFNIKGPGVSHSEEIGYLFYSYITKKFSSSKPTLDSNYMVINRLTQMWTDFAKTGNPTPTTNLWLSVNDSQSGTYNYLNIDTNLEMKIFQKGEERWDWEERKKKLLTFNTKI